MDYKLLLVIEKLLELQLVRECLFLNDALNQRIQITALLVVGRANVVYAVVEKQIGNLVLLTLLVNGDRYATLLFDERHAGNIGNTVAKIDHILIRNFALANLIVDLFVFGLIVNALGNTEHVLRFLGVVDGDLGPDCLAVLVKMVLASKDLFETIADLRALDDLLDTAGNNVVLNVNANRFAKEIDALKPVENTLVEANVLARGTQIFLGDVNALFLAKLHGAKEIAENAFHIVLFSIGFYLAPKLGGRHTQIGDKGIVLHILIAQGFIKVVHKSNGWLFAHKSTSHFFQFVCIVSHYLYYSTFLALFQ